jgi:hypothetical protein
MPRSSTGPSKHMRGSPTATILCQAGLHVALQNAMEVSEAKAAETVGLGTSALGLFSFPWLLVLGSKSEC